MNDLDTQIRETLARHAEVVRTDPDAWGAITERIERGSQIELRTIGAPTRRVPLLLAAAAVLVVAMVGAFLVTRDDDASIDLGPAAPDEVEGGVPAWFDRGSAAPVYQSKQADPDAAVARYVGDRFGETSPALTVAPVVRNGAFASATWRTNEEGGVLIASGTILLREDRQENEWEVVGSFIDQVALDGATHDGVRARIAGRNWSGQTARLDAGGGAWAELADEFDRTLEVGAEAWTIRIELVGGTTLGIAELRLDPPKGYPIWPVVGYEALADLQADADERGLVSQPPVEVAIELATEALGMTVEDATTPAGGTAPDFETVTLGVGDGQQLVVQMGRAAIEGSRWYVIGAATPGFGVFVEDGVATVTAPVSGALGIQQRTDIARLGSIVLSDRAAPDETTSVAWSGTGIIQAELLADDGQRYVYVGIVR
jgi:hypothetical protein